ncbi:MAG: thioredoxin family protein [Bacteroidota bacterium]
MKDFIQKALDASRSYEDYRSFLTDLLAEGKTTGPNQSEFYIQIANLNQQRMNRLDKRTKLIPELIASLAKVDQPYTFLVLTEGWCGDAAQIVPILDKLVEASPNLDMRLVLRDEHLELMDLFLTDGGRSIPKVLVLDPDSLEVVTTWGPRPAPAQKMSMDYKYHPDPKPSYELHHHELHAWYAKDKTQTTQSELLDLVNQLASAEVVAS